MARDAETAAGDFEEEVGKTIVRTFTDQLNGETELERATIEAQKQRDEADEMALDQRMRGYYEGTSEDLSVLDFSAAEIARKELEAMCREITREIQPSRLERIGNRFGIHRKSAKAEANEIISNSVASDFRELWGLVEDYETQWKSTQGRVHQNFQRLCRSLDAHKKVLQIFPQHDIYTSVFCGSLSLIIEASVNHQDIAETLSNAVAEISIKASLCSQLVDVIRTQPMREQLSSVYAQVFRFYRNAIEWYVSSTRSKFFGSFNERIKSGLEETQQTIKKTIKHMFYACSIATAAMLKVVHRDTATSKAEIFRQRQDHSTTGADAGEFMQELLKAMYRFQPIEKVNIRNKLEAFEERIVTEEVGSAMAELGRSEVRVAAERLEEFIVGDEGHSLFEAGQLWLSDPEVFMRLQDWMVDNETCTLWVSSPPATQIITGAQATAMNAVLAAWQVKAPVISHFCERPRWSNQDQTSEETGMIGLVYSLIVQLLQFNVEEDKFDMKAHDLERLDGSTESFQQSLTILYELLTCTPQVKYCVIHDLNALEWGGGADWCHYLLDVLFHVQREAEGQFHILLTTSGESRVLAERVVAEHRCFAGKKARHVPLAEEDAEACDSARRA